MSRPTPTPAKPGQESVWDYPRPPRVEPSTRLVRIEHAGRLLAESRRALRVLETSHPPTYYVPPDDFAPGVLEPSTRASWCEWKGRARYWHLRAGDALLPDAGWSYPDPAPAFAALADHVAIHPARVDRCTLDGVPVRAQAGGFYGGWITPDLVGPFKGEPGTEGW